MFAQLLLAWSRTVTEHGLTFEAWLDRPPTEEGEDGCSE